MSRYIKEDALIERWNNMSVRGRTEFDQEIMVAPSIDIVRCKDCKKSHIDGKTTHYLWCTEWGRSTDVFGYCERGESEGE